MSTVVAVKNPSLLSKTNCEDLVKLKNEAVIDEMQKRAPLLYHVLKAAVTSRQRKKKIKEGQEHKTCLQGLAMVYAILMRMRSPTLSALAYRISMVLHHSGAKKRVSVNITKILTGSFYVLFYL